MPPGTRYRIVLVRPRNPNNIGAAARAMANFGLDDLAVVDPHEPVWKETTSALDGNAVLQNARKLSLIDALAGCGLVIGTTTGRRRRLSQPLVSLPDFSRVIKSRKVTRIAIIFGSEKTGLTNAELDRCQLLLRIPTAKAAPSMNLGQAVAVVSYEVTRSNSISGHPFKGVPEALFSTNLPNAAQTEDLVEKIAASMRILKYKDTVSPASIKSELRKSVPQWNLRKKDMALLQGLLKRVAESAK